MFPWIFFWSPQLNLPLSGAVTQDISPKAFFDAIEPGTGDGEIERAVFDEVASYGKQIGVQAEVLMWLAEKAAAADPHAPPALEQLRTLQHEVETVKARHRQRRLERADHLLESLAKSDPDGLALLLARHRPHARVAPPPAAPQMGKRRLAAPRT